MGSFVIKPGRSVSATAVRGVIRVLSARRPQPLQPPAARPCHLPRNNVAVVAMRSIPSVVASGAVFLVVVWYDNHVAELPPLEACAWHATGSRGRGGRRAEVFGTVDSAATDVRACRPQVARAGDRGTAAEPREQATPLLRAASPLLLVLPSLLVGR
jgi:hypothetical protein